MTRVRSGSLQLGYARSVFGYDIRAKLQLRGNSILCPATIDTLIWPQTYDEVPNNCQHGLNLFRDESELISFVYDRANLVDSEVVAFDIPTERARSLSAVFGFDLIDFATLSSNPMWHLIGFDVIDPVASTSGIHTLWNEVYRQKISEGGLDLKTNEYGLLGNESTAIQAAVFFDGVFESAAGQSPFTPCGVWLRVETQ